MMVFLGDGGLGGLGGFDCDELEGEVPFNVCVTDSDGNLQELGFMRSDNQAAYLLIIWRYAKLVLDYWIRLIAMLLV